MTHKRTLVLNCLVFGRYFRNTFLDHLLESLICANIIEFATEFKVIFIVSSPQEEQDVIQNHPNFIFLAKYITFEFQPLSLEQVRSKDLYRNSKLMKTAHKYASNRAENLNSLLGILVPDMVVSEGYFLNIKNSLESNVALLLAPALRMTYLDQFLTFQQNNKNTGYKSSNLVKNALHNLHSETESFIFSNDNFLKYQNYQTPTAALFKHKMASDSFVGFGMSWFIVYIDFSKLSKKTKKRIQKALSQHTLDAYVIDSIYKQNDALIDLVVDSDQIFVLSWDKSKAFERKREINLDIQINAKQKCSFIELGLVSGLYDTFKIENFNKPFFWNGGKNSTDFNVSNYEIDIEFQQKFLARRTNFFKPGLFVYLKKLSEVSNFGKISTNKMKYHADNSTNRINNTSKMKFISRVIIYFFTFRLTMRNPLNQPLGGRILAIARLGTYYFFIWKSARQKAVEKN